MEIKDNELLRQFETTTESGLVSIEYSLQERKIFLTKFCENENSDEEMHQEFIKNVLAMVEERNLKVVPTHLKLIKFFRKNRKYQEMLPPGIKI
ncbi:Acetyltransferase [Flavobacterium sp. 9AF]|uniref:GNAT family N-acetyltransferase n=1 Tax=Flavobacterium sp. 9AF TaxID=2653142 RepID=UPI0012F2E0D5|nr:N-acetyltransferase [Flavobacterium sp. 9AF]VXB58086.1 Acetyltransferase [Flavobacterium sp. 9AF]